MLALSWNVCLVACLVSQKRYECSQVQRYKICWTPIRFKSLLDCASPFRSFERTDWHSHIVLFPYPLSQPSSEGSSRHCGGLQRWENLTNSKERACWSETKYRVRKLLEDQSGYWSVSFDPAGYGFRRTMIEYLLYTRVCRTAYRLFISW
jgi:hypothetical protein